tara:strand:- start:14247 stop:14771 length:525 start_codon:yes stop_codon:yes gene_type:complete
MSDKFGCATTRFTNDTLEENRNWCKKHNQVCIYNSSCPMAASLSDVPYIYVVEMNIETKLVEGVGLILNKNWIDTSYKVYKDPLYNLFTYKSNCRMDRSDFILDNEVEILNLLDKLLFKGYTHVQRGSGFTIMRNKIVFKIGRGEKRIEETYNENWVQFFNKAFIRHYGDKLTI